MDGAPARLLAEAAARSPRAPALLFPSSLGGGGVPYAALAADARRIARGLLALGLEPGERAVLLVPPGRDFYPLAFGMLGAGIVPVVVDPGMGAAAVADCLRRARPAAFVGTPRAHLARLALRLGGPGLRLAVTAGRRLLWGGVTLDEVRRRGDAAGAPEPREPAAGDPAAVLFTSGSTGPPRGALYTQGNLAAQAAAVRDAFGIEPGEVDLPTFPLFALFDPALGMATVVPPMDPTRPARADPALLAAAMREHGVTTMFGSPALLDPLARRLEGGERVPSLRRVISAGAPVPAATVARLAAALGRGARVHTPYGATEALPVASIDDREILGGTASATARGEGTCVGAPVPGIELALVRVDDGPIPRWDDRLRVPAGTPGEVCVRGARVTASYFEDREGDARSKIRAADGTTWHRMGDVGRMDAHGRLWFLGRKSQRIRAAGGDLYADAGEAVFLAHPAVRRAALVPVRGRSGFEPVLVVEPAPPARDRDRVAAELAALARAHPTTAGVRGVLFRPGLPVDARHNSKIRREQLARWASTRA